MTNCRWCRVHGDLFNKYLPEAKSNDVPKNFVPIEVTITCDGSRGSQNPPYPWIPYRCDPQEASSLHPGSDGTLAS